MDYYCDDEYYEPSEEEMFLDELKNKFKDILHSDIKNRLEKLEKENAELRKTVSDYNNENRDLSIRERNLKHKEDNLKSEVEREFYNKKINEVFENLLTTCEVWYAEHIGHEKPKCALCDENRNLVAKYPNGDITTKKCDCASLDYWYEPKISKNQRFEFHKSFNVHYSNDRRVYLKRYHQPSKDHADAYDCYCDFKIEKIFDKFTDEIKEYYHNASYGEKIGFTNKEECQKYCDWLNNKSR